MSSSPAEDQYKKLDVTCCRLTISWVDFPTRNNPGTRNAQLAASKITNRTRRDDLVCPDIRRSCPSLRRAEADLGQDQEFFCEFARVLALGGTSYSFAEVGKHTHSLFRIGFLSPQTVFA
jgi:hypothetical protein